MASDAARRQLGLVAEASIQQWQRERQPTEAFVLRARLLEGRRKEGVSREHFEHMFGVLSSMTCWDAAEAERPWEHHVVYEVQPEALERDVTDLRARYTDIRATLACDTKGNEANLALAYHDPALPRARLEVGTAAAIEVSCETVCTSRTYLKKEAQFAKITVESRKTFTFREHFDWQYTFILRSREPYYDNQDLMANVTEKDMTFCDPPLCMFEITCDGLKDTTDHMYLADSLLCKITDLLAPAWRGLPIRPPGPTKTPSKEQQQR